MSQYSGVSFLNELIELHHQLMRLTHIDAWAPNGLGIVELAENLVLHLSTHTLSGLWPTLLWA